MGLLKGDDDLYLQEKKWTISLLHIGQRTKLWGVCGDLVCVIREEASIHEGLGCLQSSFDVMNDGPPSSSLCLPLSSSTANVFSSQQL